MSRNVRIALAGALVAIVGAVPVAHGARGSAEATPTPTALFKSNCATCHTLAATKSKGKIGPNLDKIKPSVALLKKQITNGGGGMPPFKGKLTAKQITAIASFVYASTHKKT